MHMYLFYISYVCTVSYYHTTHRSQAHLISPQILTSCELAVQSPVNRPHQVVQGYFLKSASSCVQKLDDVFGSVTLPVRVAHWQGC